LIRAYIDNLYRGARGVSSGLDPSVSTQAVLTFLARKAGQRVRGVLRGLPGTYLGRNVELRGRGKLSLGRQTVIGASVQIDALSRSGILLGDHCTIDSHAILRGSGVIRHLGEGIDVGARTAIGAFNVILGQGGVHIGNDCLLGPNVSIVSENHNFSSTDRPIREQGETRLSTWIGNDVWIGAGVTVLGGASIGDGCVIAAGAVVRGHIPANSIAGGVPARVIRNREMS
jgi:acetyltransferase-like isoleucine patch superfamily enzyme